MDFLKGKKTNLSAGALLVWAIVGMAMGFIEAAEALPLILGALAVFGIGKKIERSK